VKIIPGELTPSFKHALFISTPSAIHHENQPHRFAVSLTASRSHPASAGRHFFMSKYGIRIAGAPNSLVV
jgi:hypothetical protein